MSILNSSCVIVPWCRLRNTCRWQIFVSSCTMCKRNHNNYVCSFLQSSMEVVLGPPTSGTSLNGRYIAAVTGCLNSPHAVAPSVFWFAETQDSSLSQVQCTIYIATHSPACPYIQFICLQPCNLGCKPVGDFLNYVWVCTFCPKEYALLTSG